MSERNRKYQPFQLTTRYHEYAWVFWSLRTLSSLVYIRSTRTVLSAGGKVLLSSRPRLTVLARNMLPAFDARHIYPATGPVGPNQSVKDVES
ncbi:unnamed protein product [Rhizoctonia solani]|uniref:Uncharacterized protein n=1 Tax=Rhizoctonia solani TaxID=456999 RepID=A0A8H3DDN2_9AGAM|nr:unnamed protein product [Rhizoctonia solani]CAE6518942.1 unnamed protein product [Rhizoctonia solani]